MSFGPNPWQQQSWDGRAAANFMGGGAGSGLLVFAALAGGPRWLLLAGAALVALGLLSVFLEIGRPLRAMNVIRHPGRSWMSREALVAPLLFGAVAVAWFGGARAAWLVVLPALAAAAFVYCQARMLQAAKGIPAWREPLTVPLIVATGLAEGGGLWLLLAAAAGPAPALPWLAFALALLARLALWGHWRRSTTPAISSRPPRCCRWPPRCWPRARRCRRRHGSRCSCWRAHWRWPAARGSSSRSSRAAPTTRVSR